MVEIAFSSYAAIQQYVFQYRSFIMRTISAFMAILGLALTSLATPSIADPRGSSVGQARSGGGSSGRSATVFQAGVGKLQQGVQDFMERHKTSPSPPPPKLQARSSQDDDPPRGDVSGPPRGEPGPARESTDGNPRGPQEEARDPFEGRIVSTMHPRGEAGEPRLVEGSIIRPPGFVREEGFSRSPQNDPRSTEEAVESSGFKSMRILN